MVECHCYRLDKNDYALAPSCSLCSQVTLQVAHQKLFIDHSSIRHIHNSNSNSIRGYARAVAFLKAGRHNHAPLLSVDTVHLPPSLSLPCSLLSSFYYTVYVCPSVCDHIFEPLYTRRRHHWDPAVCPLWRVHPNLEIVCAQFNVVETASVFTIQRHTIFGATLQSGSTVREST